MRVLELINRLKKFDLDTKLNFYIVNESNNLKELNFTNIFDELDNETTNIIFVVSLSNSSNILVKFNSFKLLLSFTI